MHLVNRQEQWVLTFQGWLVTIVFVIACGLFVLTSIHQFLAPNSPLEADVLVVEGWMPDHAIKQAIREFENGGYQKLITTGLPLSKGYYLAQYKNSAELSAATLVTLGFNPDKLVAVPGPEVMRNRTFASAQALRQWIDKSDLKIQSINLYSLDVHTRRSWLVFRKVLAPDIKVGVIAVQPLTYEPKRWWIYSEGVRSIIGETIAYIYARFVDWRS
ncbi:MAG: ElyC/SanA/YdcF family protein [Coleofasciculaceae cyanobacterium]